MGLPQHGLAARQADDQFEDKYGDQCRTGSYDYFQLRHAFIDGFFFALSSQGIPNEESWEEVEVTEELLEKALHEVVDSCEELKSIAGMSTLSLCKRAAVALFRDQPWHNRHHAVIRQALKNFQTHGKAVP